MYRRCAIAASLECFPEKPSWCRNEQVCQRGAKSVKRFERSHGLDTALYKNIPLTFYLLHFLMSFLQPMYKVVGKMEEEIFYKKIQKNSIKKN